MKNNKLIIYKKSIFDKIASFLKKIFSKKKIFSSEVVNIDNNKNNSFIENIQIKENEEDLRLYQLKQQYENGEIDEEDLSEEDVNKIIKLYEEETEQLNQDTLRRKIHIQNMLKELKYNN